MSHPQPPTRQPTPTETNQYASTIHNVAFGALFLCPALALLPPRKLDLYTLALVTSTGFSANYLYRERYNRSIWERAISAVPTDDSASLPTEKAREFQQMMRERRLAEGRVEEKNLAQKVWMGGESEGWKERREREDREKLAEGKGYGDIIMDQIWEVWNWGKVNEDAEEGSEKKG